MTPPRFDDPATHIEAARVWDERAELLKRRAAQCDDSFRAQLIAVRLLGSAAYARYAADHRRRLARQLAAGQLNLDLVG